MIWVGEESDTESNVYNKEDFSSLSHSSRQQTWCQGPDSSFDHGSLCMSLYIVLLELFRMPTMIRCSHL